MSGRWPRGSSTSRRSTRPGGGRSTRSPPGSSRWSCCAGPVGSTRDSAAAGGSGPPGRSRWRCSPATRSPIGRQAARAPGSIGPVVHCAHRAPAGAAPADRPPGGGDGAARADRGGGGRAGRGARAEGARAGRDRHSGGGGVPPRRPRRARRVAEAIAVEHPAVRQAAADLVPAPARRATWSRWTPPRPPEKLAAEIVEAMG